MFNSVVSMMLAMYHMECEKIFHFPCLSCLSPYYSMVCKNTFCLPSEVAFPPTHKESRFLVIYNKTGIQPKLHTKEKFLKSRWKSLYVLQCYLNLALYSVYMAVFIDNSMSPLECVQNVVQFIRRLLEMSLDFFSHIQIPLALTVIMLM